MLIAHLPAGYLVAQGFSSLRVKGIVPVALLGSIFPDLDMFYFYLVDNRQHHHHSYWTHFPSIWILLMILSACWLYFRRQSGTAVLMLVFSVSGFIHLLLDSVMGDIPWLAPYSTQFYALFTVPANFKPWWMSFILHWTFLFEVAIIIAAAVLFIRNRKKRKALSVVAGEDND